MTKRFTFSCAFLLCLSGAFICGCSEAAPRSARYSGAAPAGYRPQSELANHRDGATPSGTIGSGTYDEPGQLPANSGGTNAGRVGVDTR